MRNDLSMEQEGQAGLTGLQTLRKHRFLESARTSTLEQKCCCAWGMPGMAEGRPPPGSSAIPW